MSAFAYPPFRVYVLASFASNSSMFMFAAGLGWYILGLTGSAGSVGLASFVYSLPFALFMLHAGLLTDRFGARSLVALSLFVAGLSTVGLAILVLLGSFPLLTIFLVTFGIGTILTVGAPGTISIVNDLVPPAAVPSAVSLVFLSINVGRIAGGAAAGVLLANGSPGLTIMASGLLQAAAAVPIWRLRGARPNLLQTGRPALFRPLLEAARFTVDSPIVGVILLLSIGPGALGLAYNFLLPVAAREIGAGAGGLGLLLAGAGSGGLVAGLGAERLMRAVGHGRTIFIGLAAAAGGLSGFGVSGSLPIAMVAMAFVGGGLVVYASSSLSLVQALSPVELRGRLTALFSLLYWGLMPAGALLGGAVAGATSARFALATAGLTLFACGSIALLIRRDVASLRIAADGQAVTFGAQPEPHPEPAFDRAPAIGIGAAAPRRRPDQEAAAGRAALAPKGRGDS